MPAKPKAQRLPSVRSVVWIQRLLRRPQFDRHVLQVDADARPCMKPSAHRVDEHIGGLQMRSGFWMPRLPSLHAGERVRLPAGAGDLDQRMLGRPAARRLDPRRFAFLLAIVRRPRRIAEAIARVAEAYRELAGAAA